MNFPQKEKENSGEAGRWSCLSDPCEQYNSSFEFTISVVGAEFGLPYSYKQYRITLHF